MQTAPSPSTGCFSPLDAHSNAPTLIAFAIPQRSEPVSPAPFFARLQTACQLESNCGQYLTTGGRPVLSISRRQSLEIRSAMYPWRTHGCFENHGNVTYVSDKQWSFLVIRSKINGGTIFVYREWLVIGVMNGDRFWLFVNNLTNADAIWWLMRDSKSDGLLLEQQSYHWIPQALIYLKVFYLSTLKIIELIA